MYSVFPFEKIDFVIDKASEILCREKKFTMELFPYSEFQGFDILDVSNAMKLKIAEMFVNKTEIMRIKAFAENCDVSLEMLIRDRLAPDEVVMKQSTIDHNDFKESILFTIEVTKNNDDWEWNKLFKKREGVSTFFSYCKNVDSINLSYFWNKVYHKLID